LAPKNSSTTKAQGDELPFGTIKGQGEKAAGGAESPPSKRTAARKKKSKASRSRKTAGDESAGPEPAPKAAAENGRDRNPSEDGEPSPRPAAKRPSRKRPDKGGSAEPGQGEGRSESAPAEGSEGQRVEQKRGDEKQSDGRREGAGKRRGSRRGGRRRRGRDRDRDQRDGAEGGRPRHGGGQQQDGQRRGQQRAPKGNQTLTGMFVLEKGDYGTLRREEAQWKPSKEDIYVPKRMIDRERLRDGALVEGRVSRGQKHKYQLNEVLKIDGRPPADTRKLRPFKALTSIDPDFHYSTGDLTDNVSMRIVDLLCPIGRGQRGLIVAPPRSGKTTLMREFAHGIEVGYPDVHLMVLLIDERPEEATEWRRSVERGQVFVSTADETAKTHIQLAEAVWKRACRLVELGEDVVLLLDSITRLARAYNNQAGAGGRTMSGGLDSRAMERPRKIFGSARNTETAGSLTILGTTLVDTGSRLDQMVFEEFKGTGNMELVLARRLADRRIFPAIDVERSGTRKEEKLVGTRRLRLLHTLRRVLARMNFVEAMELLITRLDDVEKTDDFLNRFEVDPDA